MLTALAAPALCTMKIKKSDFRGLVVLHTPKHIKTDQIKCVVTQPRLAYHRSC